MALNWTMLNPNRSPVPLPNEMTITAADAGVEVSLNVPDAPPSSTASAGGSGGSKESKAVGKVWLTDQRVRRYLPCVLWNGTDSVPFLLPRLCVLYVNS